MGSPSLGPTLANAFLCYHEKIQLRNYPSEFKPVNDASYFFAQNTALKNSKMI